MCPGTPVGNGVCDGSWCSHVGDNNKWPASSCSAASSAASACTKCDAPVLLQNANTPLVEREM